MAAFPQAAIGRKASVIKLIGAFLFSVRPVAKQGRVP